MEAQIKITGNAGFPMTIHYFGVGNSHEILQGLECAKRAILEKVFVPKRIDYGVCYEDVIFDECKNIDWKLTAKNVVNLLTPKEPTEIEIYIAEQLKVPARKQYFQATE